MKTSGWFVAGAVVAALVGSVGQAAENAPKPAATVTLFENMDVNKDGTVTVEEYVAGRTGDFAKLDGDKDGKLTPEELKGQSKLYKPSAAGPAFTETEFLAAFVPGATLPDDALVSTIQAYIKANPVSSPFQRMDANQNGKVTPEEMATFFVILHRDMKLSNVDARNQYVAGQWFRELDFNADGSIDVSEYAAPAPKGGFKF